MFISVTVDLTIVPFNDSVSFNATISSNLRKNHCTFTGSAESMSTDISTLADNDTLLRLSPTTVTEGG